MIRRCAPPMLPRMFAITDADTAAILDDAFDQNGEMAATTELRRRFPGLSENAGLEAARMIVRWRPPQNDGATGDASAYK